jgi:hypothetical protein
MAHSAGDVVAAGQNVEGVELQAPVYTASVLRALSKNPCRVGYLESQAKVVWARESLSQLPGSVKRKAQEPSAFDSL